MQIYKMIYNNAIDFVKELKKNKRITYSSLVLYIIVSHEIMHYHKFI